MTTRDDDLSPAALSHRLRQRRLTRRDSLWLFAASTGAVALGGCDTSPVTGKSIVVGMSPAQERAIDQRQAPHQFSADLGAVQDARLNGYVEGVTQRLVPHAHRKDTPYSARVLNANYVNAYTFPAGTMGVTRGIMIEMQDEAELAALLGHEMGHVNARHSAQRQGQAMIAQAAVAGLTIASSDSRWSPLIGLGSQIGASALLAGYSRDNEREADALGQRYMVAAGYPAQGMTRLHEILLAEEKEKPSAIATMFATHPMSRERRDTAARLADTTFAASRSLPPGRERYMDNTAGLRRLKPTIVACQDGEAAMSRKRLPEAEQRFQEALRLTPGDYAANLRMAQCQQALGRTAQARRYAQTAREIYPQEAQAAKLGATLKLASREPAGALEDLQAFDRLLPGDPGVLFLKGVAYEGMGQQRPAAEHFAQYLRAVPSGDASGYASQRLKAWGFAR
jgi:predicted Zn-dependent protease